ncbi:glycosyltransferase family 39 protein [Nocardioides sp. BP30]|uniref:glycosyltransferase family 39 protein n=1 Tax=Nocardioides sp. BP30 TaxID=3036374 RepID=UPI002468EE70|nr:glycosyltransferase family 39 protein [Nocardioides sp. BP30]WGL51406.1 glycosyltransferase family 39 protein [Nocardioides sp. BP30]
MSTVLDRRASLDHPLPPPTRADRGRLARLVRGREEDPPWARPALLALLLATAALYTWDLAASGYANSFYAAATQAGSQSWKAWFFGSLDAGNSITVDKPPAALWVDGLSARIFGFGSWSLLVPQALEGVAAVGLLYGAVRRTSGHLAGILAGIAFALTPAAALIFRFDNPDALLVLLMVAAAYAVVRSLEHASTRWLLLAGTALGFAFLTKMLQGFLVLPAFGLVYLVAAPTSLRRRIGQLLMAAGAVVVSAGWWVAAVAVWPASARPYIGGSTDNSVLNLVFGYNGLGRLFGQDGAGGGGMSGGAAGSSFGGATGLNRLFSSEMGNEISWLLPAAGVALIGGLWAAGRSPRTDRTRAALLLWGGWIVVTGLVFSYMSGTIHPYYTVALAPAIAGSVASGGRALWLRRQELAARVGLAAMVLAAAGWSVVLLGHVSSWHPELRYAIIVLGVVAVAGLLVPPGRLGKATAGVLAAAIISGLLGTGSFAVATAASPHTGSIPSVGPAVAASSTGGMGGPGGSAGPGGSGGSGGSSGSSGSGGAPSGTRPTGTPPSGTTGTTSGTGAGSSTTGETTGDTGGGMSGGMGGGGMGVTTSSALTTALKATTTTWAAATAGDSSAAELELATGKSVMAIGGWSGTDESPTLAQFEAYVAAGRIHYYIAGGTGGGPGGQSGSASSQITAWVEAHYTATTIGGTTVYDLAATPSS